MKLSPSHLRDQLGNADRARVAVATFALMDALQKQKPLKPGEALAALKKQNRASLGALFFR